MTQQHPSNTLEDLRPATMDRSLKPPPPPSLPSLKRAHPETISLLSLSRPPQLSPQRKRRVVSAKFSCPGGLAPKSHHPGRDTKTVQNAEKTGEKWRPNADTEMEGPAELEPFARDSEPSGTWSSNQMEGVNEHDDSLALYIDAVQSECVGFIHLFAGLFAVEGWSKNSSGGTNHWFHFETSSELPSERELCSCRQGQLDCFHKRYFKLHGQDDFSMSPADSGGKCPRVILFTKEIQDYKGERAIHRFSVTKEMDTLALSNCVFVTHEGSDKGDGIWKCVRDGRCHCMHIKAAQKYMNPNNIEADNTEAESGIDISLNHQQARLHGERATSHLRITPPRWALLPTETNIQSPPPLRENPGCIRLTPQASCCCRDGGRDFYNPEHPSMFCKCTVYTLTHAFVGEIELQICSRCPRASRRYIGPEPRDMGLFNYNNCALFSHKVLNEYLSAFSSSVTPFEAWVDHVNRRYQETAPYIPFARGALFRSAWFAYARLLGLDGDKLCPRCGDAPESIIWDGVSIAFSRKHVNNELQPPTSTSDISQIRESKPLARQEWLPDSAMRRTLRGWLEAGGLDVEKCDDHNHEARLKNLEAAVERTSIFSTLEGWLRSQNHDLATLFCNRLGYGQINEDNRWRPQKEYLSLFQLLAAEESTMQTLNLSGLQALNSFLQQPSCTTANLLLCAPILFRVIEQEFGSYGRCAAEVLGTLLWMYRQGLVVLRNLWMIDTKPLEETQVLEHNRQHEIRDWERTGACYSMPQIRVRPKYPKIPKDGKADINKERSGTCRKYYEQYSQKWLTGGIMACWCMHSVCYGFHCIPLGEGRNDVFSAIVTRWPQAPKRVIYDFACALGPYCWTREPRFFAETEFLIDDFHASGHTKCSTSAFLKTHSAVQSKLRVINSSAAECGNSGLARIRKSVSYMTQPRAILYCWVFISIWNCLRIQKLKKEEADLE